MLLKLKAGFSQVTFRINISVSCDNLNCSIFNFCTATREGLTTVQWNKEIEFSVIAVYNQLIFPFNLFNIDDPIYAELLQGAKQQEL